MTATRPKPRDERGGDRPYFIFSITLPAELRNIVRAEVPEGETLTATIRQLLREALEARGSIPKPKCGGAKPKSKVAGD